MPANLKEQMQAYFLTFLQEILTDENKINLAVKDREAAKIDGNKVDLSAIDETVTFNDSGNIEYYDEKKIWLDIDRLNLQNYNNLSFLTDLSFRERLILDSAISSAQNKLWNKYDSLMMKMENIPDDDDLTALTNIQNMLKNTPNIVLTKLESGFSASNQTKTQLLKDPKAGFEISDSLSTEIEKLSQEYSHLIKPKVIEIENTDLYKFPIKKLPNDGSITIPDLHGNTLKLVHFLMSHGVIGFKDNVDATAAYGQFTKLYDDAGKLADDYNKQKHELVSAQAEFDRQSMRTDATPELRATWITEAETRKKTAEENLKNSQQELKFAKILDGFNQFLDQLKVTNTTTLVRLIGDDLGDRGSNDYFTLKLLEFLQQNQVKESTLISNHGIEFVRSWVKPSERSFLSPEDRLSYIGLNSLVDLDLIAKQDVQQLINKTYKPSLKILDYSLNDEGIVLFSHAPVRFDSIKHTANRLGVSYDDSTNLKLAETIENINTAFQFELDGKYESTIYQEYFSFLDSDRGGEITGGLVDDPAKASMTAEEIAKWPLVYLTWNRWDQAKDQDSTARPAEHKGYSIQYVHGHDDHQSIGHEHVANLDTPLGKYPPGPKRDRAAQREKNINKESDITKYKVMVAPYDPVAPTLTRDNWLGNQIQKQATQQQTVKSTIPIKTIIAAIGLGLAIGLGFGVGVAMLVSGVAAPFGAGLIGVSLFAASTGAAGALFAAVGVFLGLRGNKNNKVPHQQEETREVRSAPAALAKLHNETAAPAAKKPAATTADQQVNVITHTAASKPPSPPLPAEEEEEKKDDDNEPPASHRM